MADTKTDAGPAMDQALKNAKKNEQVEEYDVPVILLKRCREMYIRYLNDICEEFENDGMGMAFGRARFRANQGGGRFQMFRHVDTRNAPPFARPVVKYLMEVNGLRPGDADQVAGEVLEKYLKNHPI